MKVGIVIAFIIGIDIIVALFLLRAFFRADSLSMRVLIVAIAVITVIVTYFIYTREDKKDKENKKDK
jgi:hypothetical protein